MRLPRVACGVLVAGGLLACAGEQAVGVDARPGRGIYYWGHEVETFTPCGANVTYWVAGDATVLVRLREHANAKAAAAGAPYQPVYVELAGTPEAKASDGFAADYDGVYRVASVTRSDSVLPADCAAPGGR